MMTKKSALAVLSASALALTLCFTSPPAYAAVIEPTTVGSNATISSNAEKIDYWGAEDFSISLTNIETWANEGDTVNFEISDSFLLYGSFPNQITDHEGNVIANVTNNTAGITLTFTNYVDIKQNVRLNIAGSFVVNRDKVKTTSDQQLHFTINGTPVTNTITVPVDRPSIHPTNAIYKWMSFEDDLKQYAGSNLYWGVNIDKQDFMITSLTLVDTPGAGVELRCSSYDNLITYDATPGGEWETFAPDTITCTPQQMTLTFTPDTPIPVGTTVHIHGAATVSNNANRGLANNATLTLNGTKIYERDVALMRANVIYDGDGNEIVLPEKDGPTPPTEDEDSPAPPIEDTDDPAPPTEDEDDPAPPTEDEDEPTPPTEDEDDPTPPAEDEDSPTPPTENTDDPTPPVEDEDSPTPPVEDEDDTPVIPEDEIVESQPVPDDSDNNTPKDADSNTEPEVNSKVDEPKEANDEMGKLVNQMPEPNKAVEPENIANKTITLAKTGFDTTNYLGVAMFIATLGASLLIVKKKHVTN